MSRDHRKLKAFQLADALVMDVYRTTRAFPKEEMFGLTSQMRRAAVSVAANIVEGCARRTQKDYVQFLNVAFGSLREVGYFLNLASRLEYVKDPATKELSERYEETSRVLFGLIRSLTTERKSQD
ncbi:MAG: four helix bundle protein [Phycisphaeraceae bacterium]